MSDVRSKNLYELLGNDSDQDSDREPDAPVKTADKTAARKGKRDAPATAPTEPRGAGAERGGRGGRRGGYGNEDAFRDRNAGSGSNRSRPTEDGARFDRTTNRHGHSGNFEGRGRGRGGRGRGRGDRQDRTGHEEHQKQSDLSWGAPTGDSEWKDEQAGEAMAKAEEKEGWDSSVAAPIDGDGEKFTEAGATEEREPEPEDNSKSYADYLAEQATKRMEGLGLLEARKPNEGAKADKKWAKATALKRDETEEEFIKAREERSRRDRQRKQKDLVDVDYNWQEGGGGRGRGDGRGRGRGDRGSRGGRGRGDGFRGRGRGAFRGGSVNNDGGSGINVVSDENFPSLGSK